MAKHGKKYMAAVALIDRDTEYAPKKAFSILKESNQANFDPTVEVVFRLGVDPRKADQMIRGALSLPHGTGKTARVAVVANAEKVTEALEAGADHVGGDDLVELMEQGDLLSEIDSIIATPDMMGKLGRLGKVLGPRGLMPNPKSGTVTMDVAKAVREIKGGRVEYRTDRQANVHCVLGKASFGLEQLVENYGAFLDEMLRQRPASAKGKYIKTIAISTSVGPGIRIDGSRTRDLLSDGEQSRLA